MWSQSVARRRTTATGIVDSAAASVAESTVPDMSPDRCAETTAVAPASRMWYPLIEIVFQRGIRSSQ